MENRAWRLIALVLRILLGAVMMYAAYTKMREPWRIFAMDIEAYKVVTSMFWIEVIARGLPWFEMILGIWLITGVSLRGSTTITAMLLLGFMGLMLWAQLHKLDINCGCFGSGDKISWLTQLRDGSLLVTALVLAVWSHISHRRSSKLQMAQASLA
jgi:hypothetical protein